MSKDFRRDRDDWDEDEMESGKHTKRNTKTKGANDVVKQKRASKDLSRAREKHADYD